MEGAIQRVAYTITVWQRCNAGNTWHPYSLIIKMGLNEVADYKNLRNEGIKCCRGGRWKLLVQGFEMTIARSTSRLKMKLNKRSYRPSKTNDFYITERGKVRLIRAHAIRDRQVYKAFCTYELKPTIENYILDHNNASQVGKGTDRSIKQFRQGLAKAYKKFGKDFYVVMYDYSNYFGSLDHDIIRQIPVSDDTKWLLNSYVNVFEKMDHKYYGIGIGGEPSQDIAIVYGSKIHRMICCEPYVIDSGWYMDDGYIIVHTKDEARRILTKVIAASTKYKLQLNFKRTKIFWMQKDSVAWLKKRTFISDTGKIVMRLTRKNVCDEIHRLRTYKYFYDKGIIPLEVVNQSIICWCTYAKPYNSNKATIRVIDYYMSLFGISDNKKKLLLRRNKKGLISNLPIHT